MAYKLNLQFLFLHLTRFTILFIFPSQKQTSNDKEIIEISAFIVNKRALPF